MVRKVGDARPAEVLGSKLVAAARSSWTTRLQAFAWRHDLSAAPISTFSFSSPARGSPSSSSTSLPVSKASFGGELFDLPNQGAHDISRHDVVKDIVRVEGLLTAGLADSDWVIALSNDSSYWRPGTKTDPIDAMFRVHEGRQLGGVLQWSASAGQGTTRGRDRPLVLQSVYTCGWRQYATVTSTAGRAVQLRHLAFAIEPE